MAWPIFGQEEEDEDIETIPPTEEKQDSADEDKTVDLGNFVVTGSRIREFDIDKIAPIESYSREEIEAAGITQISDLIRKLPITAGSSEADQSLSFAGDGAQANLRGIGVGGTLVLVNGRRVVPYALATGNGNTFVDLNSIPFSAIERIDFLRGGSSAIYGSDALAGVVNYILRRDYQGLEISGSYSNTTRGDDISTARFDLAYGTRQGNWNYSLFLNHFTRNALQLTDREFSSSPDHTAEGGFNLLDWHSYPGLFEAQTNVNTFLFAGDATNDDADTYQRFNFNEFQTAISEAERSGATFIATTNLENGVDFFVEASLQDNRSKSQSAPAAFERPYTIPGNHPNNPFLVFFGADIPISNAMIRPTDVGPRRFTIDSVASRITTGFEGEFGKNGEWDVSYMYGRSEVDRLAENLVRVDLFQEALNRTDGLVLNPFASGPDQGDNAEIYQSLLTDDRSRAVRDMHQISFGASEEIGSLQDRPIRAYLGFEYREERMNNRRSQLSEDFLLFGSGGTSAEGKRELWSAYGEVVVPITRKLEAHAAVRHEEYSDFGSSTNPKINLKFNPISDITLLASYANAFQAPSLEQAYGGVLRGFNQEQDRLRLAFEIPNSIPEFEDDPYPFDDYRSREIRTEGNPLLDPQTADHYSAGIVYAPSFIENLSIALHGWRYEVDDLIASRSMRGLLQDEIDLFLEDQIGFLQMDPAERAVQTGIFRGPNIFYPDAAITTVPGHVDYVRSEYINFDGFYLEGLDFEAYYNHQTATRGQFVFRNFTQFFNRFVEADFNLVGFVRLPEFQSRSSISWISPNRSYSATVQSNYASGYKTIFTNIPEVGSHIVWDASFVIRRWKDLDITLGVNNLFDRDPPPLYSESEGYDNRTGLHDPRGRMAFISIKKTY